jgi:hypothetical protein
VDHYDDVLVCSIATAGMEKNRTVVLDALTDVCFPGESMSAVKDGPGGLRGWKNAAAGFTGVARKGSGFPFGKMVFTSKSILSGGRRRGFFSTSALTGKGWPDSAGG